MLEGLPVYADVVMTEDRQLASKVPKLVMGKEWVQYFGNLSSAVDAAPARQTSVRLSAQDASIGVTPLPIGSVVPGIWRVSYVARITRPGTVSSSLIVTIHWSDGGITMSQAGAAITGNTTATGQGDSVIIRSDSSTPISYSTTYASAGATTMQYALDLVVEVLAPDTV